MSLAELITRRFCNGLRQSMVYLGLFLSFCWPSIVFGDLMSRDGYAENSTDRQVPQAGVRYSGPQTGEMSAEAPGNPDSAAETAGRIEKKIDDLLARMTPEEKIGQLTLVSNGPLMDWPAVADGSAGALINFNNARDILKAQELAKNTRLGIPLLFGLDVVHGFRTQFPLPLGEAAAFDPDLSRRVAKTMAEEARYVGVNWTYAPMSDLSRDVRWGRGVEGFGEDPYLGSLLTAARVTGLQEGGLIATVKHFAGYGAPTGGRDYATTLIPEAEFRDFYLPPYQAGIDAGAGSVMSAFNALNGRPSTANGALLTGILRDQWRFDGFVTSDWGAIEELLAHGIADNEMDAAVAAIEAGVDMDMMSGFYRRNLAEAIRSGRLPQSVVDRAVRRVLRVKYRFGLFDAPPADPGRADSMLPDEHARKLTREAAVKSYVLLKNERQILPISREIGKIAVIGPLADQPCEQLGPHAARGQCEDAVSYRAGIEKRARKAGIRVWYEPGCDLFCRDGKRIGKAVSAARGSDIAIVVLGEPSDASGEAASKAYLDLSGRQGSLLDAVLATGKPVVLVLMSGRPLDIRKQVGRLGAVLMTWYPGTEGGNALADVLFGDRAPSGKLPVTYPRSVGQLPLYYNELPTGRPHKEGNRFTYGYYDESHLPLYPFGWGMSYTSFGYAGLKLEKSAGLDSRVDSDVIATVTVTNEGRRAGEEIVQAYVRKPVDARSRPVRELKAFAKVRLEPGQSQDVKLRIPLENLSFFKEDGGGSYAVSSGRYELSVGGNSDATLKADFSIVAGLSCSRRYRNEARGPTCGKR